MTDTPPRFVWLDLEMTGLDPATCAIIEVGIVITGPDLVPIESWGHAVWQPDEVLSRMEPFVREMHTKNGLLERVRSSPMALHEAEKGALALVSRHCRFGEGVLAGNSIHQDRRFLDKYMPAFERYLHYRQVDVSSIKVLARAWYPEGVQFAKDGKTHTALDDIRASLDELTHYRLHLFR